MRLLFWITMLCVELYLIIHFYLAPQFQARSAPVGHWEREVPRLDGLLVWVALIALLGLFTAANIGLLVIIWRRFKALKSHD